jgi:hypothetical protein
VVALLMLWRSRRSWWPGQSGGSEGRLSGAERRIRLLLAVPARRGQLGLLLTALAAATWWVVIGILTQAGFSGNDRYLVLGAALLAIAGGLTWAWAAHVVASVVRRFVGAGPSWASVGSVTAALFTVLFIVFPPFVATVPRVPQTHRALVYQAHLRQDMARAVSELGGPQRVLSCGTVMTEGFQVPMLAWTLGVHTMQVEGSPLDPRNPGPPPNVIFQTRAQRHSHLLPIVRAWKTAHYQLVAHVRTFRVYAQCAGKVSL